MTDLSRQYPNGNGHASGSSIYNYPEHLNPFYGDENHKRLRFWPHKSETNRSSRRGSLSSLRDGLREIWQYSTLRFGIKRSSTLGVNRTSESPPPLRSDLGTYRNTVNGSDYDAPQGPHSYTTTPLFVRHSRYRGSFQDHQKENDEIGFVRNVPYRSTIQNGFQTYSGGMMTSTPRKKRAPTQPYGTTSRSGEYNNTNPFDVEMEQDVDTMSTISVESSYSSTPRSRSGGTRNRTKRRAPPPPSVSVVPANREAPEKVEPPVDDVQSEDLRNLTAEIESFVRISSNTGDTPTQAVPAERTGAIVETTVRDQTCDVNNNAPASEIPTTVSSIENELVQEVTVAGTKKETVEVHYNPVAEHHSTAQEEQTKPVEESKPMNVPPEETSPTVSAIENVATSPVPSRRKKTVEQVRLVDDAPGNHPADIDFENLSLPMTPKPARRTNRENREKYITQEIVPASKVSHEKAAVPKPLPATMEQGDDEGPTTTIIVDNLEYKLKVAPIHTEISSKIENARMKISESTGNLPTSANESSANDRRRSVKDIIESINKSQSMLKVNHEGTGNDLHETQSTDSMVRNIRELNEREKEIQDLLQDIDTRYGAGPAASGRVAQGADEPTEVRPGRGSYYDNFADDNLNDNLDDSNNMYAASACRVKKSPTKTLIITEGDDPQFQDCINWNPLPKPRRSHIPAENVTNAE